MTRIFNDDLSIVICGEAGHGVQTVEKMLTDVLKLSGFNVFASKEYMSRVRGGSNSTQIRISSSRISAYLDRIDILIPLDKDAIPHLEKKILPSTIIIGDKAKLATQANVTDVPFEKLAAEAGKAIYVNTVAVGVMLGITGVEWGLFETYLNKYFASKGADIARGNVEAGKKGYSEGRKMTGEIEVKIARSAGAGKEVLLSGAEAVALGAVAGGCNFISAYPMTPSTAIITFLSQHASEYGIVAEQAEDEISAMNMTLGAWYAGARAMVSTAGGGFALMVEGLSLAGAIESPAVIMVGMRPSPATGLPTRTEQSDLEFVLYSGHGEFPRAVFAPGTIEEAFRITQASFDLADKYQVPVIILTDQYLMDSFYNVPEFDISQLHFENFIVTPEKGYKRYKLTSDGISPRGIPGAGEGFVCADSDEHDEDGRITESMEVRKIMMDKRMKKLGLLEKASLPPVLTGGEAYETLVIGWGSNFGVIKEAIGKIGNNSISFLHFNQVYPLHSSTSDYLKKAKNLIIVENNATSQFGKLLKLQAGVDITKKILKYDGMPFSVEELVSGIKGAING